MTNGFDLEGWKEKLKEFAQEREWEQFHTPKNLAMALSVEAAELSEIFQWMTCEQSKAQAQLPQDSRDREKFEDELSDIFVYLLRLCTVLNVDLEKAMTHKMAKNAEKYPVELARGSAKKYTEYEG